MNQIILNLRTVNVPGIGTFGTLYSHDGRVICRTVEREWLDNKPSISCVPEGMYELEWTNSPRFGECFALVNEQLGVSVSGDTTRTHILIHAANYPNELQGCIAPGQSFMELRWGVKSSRNALEALETELNSSGCDVFLRISRSGM
tara:strand:- start:1080 stop:1517 length:438 start_codon:yes stop_codon:yes gene_type:complete